jgi:hypothetical protein
MDELQPPAHRIVLQLGDRGIQLQGDARQFLIQRVVQFLGDARALLENGLALGLLLESWPSASAPGAAEATPN